MIRGYRHLEPEMRSKSTAELISEMADVAQSRPDSRTDMAFSYDPEYVNVWVTADGELKQKGRGELPEREAAELVWQYEQRARIRRSREAEWAGEADKMRAVEAEVKTKSTGELISEMAEIAKGRKHQRTSRWYVKGKAGVVWVTAGGELRQEAKPGKVFTGLPDREAAEYIWVAETKKKIARSLSAKKAAATRAKRREQKVYDVVNRLLKGGQLTPSKKCVICMKVITDDASRQRGIGSDCWQGVLQRLEEARANGR